MWLQGTRDRSRSPRRADPTARDRSRSPPRAGNAVKSSPVPSKIASAKLEILRAILAAARDPELNIRQVHDFISCAGNLHACPANPATGCENGAEDFISKVELEPEECVAIPSRGAKPNCVNISSLGHTWAGKHVTVNPFTNAFLEGPGCSVQGLDRSRNQYQDTEDRGEIEPFELIDFGPRPAPLPAPAPPTATPEERRRAALRRRNAALDHQRWVVDHVEQLEHLRDHVNRVRFHVGDENWMALARFEREEREIEAEVGQLDREIRDASALDREGERRDLRAVSPELHAQRQKIAAIKDELVEHIGRMQTTRNLPPSFMQRVREWVAGRELHLESLKRRLSEAEAERGRLRAQLRAQSH